MPRDVCFQVTCIKRYTRPLYIDGRNATGRGQPGRPQSTHRRNQLFLRVQRGLAAGERDGGPVVVGAARARHALHLAPAAQRGPQQVLVPGKLGEQYGAVTRLFRVRVRVWVWVGVRLRVVLGLRLG
eukprot:scaffold128418_cov51-Phaeocystis_antarctica.AAC.1